MHTFRDVVGDGVLRSPYDDADLLHHHEALGKDPSEVIYLSLGETWSETAPGLRAALAEAVPPHSHGDVRTRYGLPALHRVRRSCLTETHHLSLFAALAEDYEVVVSQNSTRSAMFDFGRLLVEEQGVGTDRPVVICSSPGWDYAVVFTALGYETKYFTVTPERQYQPRAGEVERLLLLQAGRPRRRASEIAVSRVQPPTSSTDLPR